MTDIDGQPECLPDELRTLFLFEALTDEQLATLCKDGHIQTFDKGPLCTEGEPATCFYVLIDGELVMSKRSGGEDIETNRTSQRGVYCGAWSAFVPGVAQIYESSVRVTRPSKFFVLDASAFGRFVQGEFPMAVHLLDGLKVGGLRQRQIIDQREKLLALGNITAGLTHQLNNPAAATARAVSDLREKVAGMRHKLAMLADGKFSPEGLRVLVTIQEEVAEQVANRRRRNSPRWKPPTARTRSVTGWKATTSSAPGTTPRRSSTPAWTPTGWSGSRRRSTRSTHRRRCRARSAG
jgi:CRP-like cAMP-binding protein